MTRRYFCSVFAMMLLLAALGCGKPQQGFVEGTVTQQGKPLTNGQVVLFCKELGSGGSAPLNAEGAFRIEKPLPAGTYLVTVRPPPPPPPLSPDGKKSSSSSRQASPIPEKYRKEQTTDLHIEVGPGNNRAEFDLK